MIKLPNSQDPAVMAGNIVHLREEIAAVDAKTLPATTSATAGQILKLTGENKTPTWSDEYSYTPPAYSETETATGQKWIDGKEIYCKVLSDNISEITQGEIITSDLAIDSLISAVGYVTATDGFQAQIGSSRTSQTACCVLKRSNGYAALYVGSTFSLGSFKVAIYYTKPDPTPGRNPSDEPEATEATPEEMKEPEEKKTTKKKTTK